MGATLADSPFPAAADVAITRQAIHDRWLRVVGYELLFLDATGYADEPAGGPIGDDERASASVVVESLTSMGLDAVVGRQSAHVRVARRFLLDQHALALPAGRIVLELDVPEPDDEPLLAMLEQLAEAGYRLSLTCDPHRPPPAAELMELIHSVKLDVTGLSDAEVEQCVERFAPVTATLIAVGVDTPADLERCRDAGFQQFQGFFFCTPDIVHVHAPPTTRLVELQSLAALYAPSITFEEFENIIARDPGLSYRLLVYLNSAFFNLPRHVSSVREALMMLGMKAVRRWATLIALSADDDKPHELTVTALLRGRFCELIGRQRPAPTAGADAFFTVGVFSVMDAMMDVPLDELLDALPLTPEICTALLERDGPMGDALSAVIAYEQGDLSTVGRRLPGLPLVALYLEAVHWADAASGALDDEAAGDDGEDDEDDTAEADGAPRAAGAQESDGEDEDAGDGVRSDGA